MRVAAARRRRNEIAHSETISRGDQPRSSTPWRSRGHRAGAMVVDTAFHALKLRRLAGRMTSPPRAAKCTDASATILERVT